jgi:hypothetical protein
VGGGLWAPVARLGGVRPELIGGGIAKEPPDRLVLACAPNSFWVGFGEGTINGDGDTGCGGTGVERPGFNCSIFLVSTGDNASTRAIRLDGRGVEG